MDRESILEKLRQRITAAEKQNREAAKRFNEVAAGYPSAIPYPDGVTQIRDASRSYRRTIAELTKAQQQMAVFLINGEAPEDLDLD